MTALLGTLAVIASVTRSWPQVFRLLKRNGSAKGVSVPTWCIATAGQTGWVIYGFGNHIVAAMISNTLNDIGCIAVLYAACRVRTDARATVTKFLGPLLVLEILVLAVFNSTAVGIMVSVLSATTFVPQAVRVIRTSVEGVSRLTWTLILISTVLWGTYGILIHKLVLSYPTLVILPSSLIVLIVTARQPSISLTTELAEGTP